ncbi:MAG: flippase-like domain-containing protein [Clostridia bacterium]|nr:flippase-like domain-containing protein [Clostridia bacterium]
MDKSKRKRNLILSILFMVLLFVLTYFIIFGKEDIDFGRVFDIITSADWRFVLAAFSMIFIYFILYGFFCRETLRFKGVKTNLVKGVVYGCTDFYFSAITPSATGGQPMVVYYMTKDDVPASAATLSTVLLTVLFKVVLLFLNLAALIMYHDVWFAAGTLFIVLWFFGLFVCLGMIALAIVTMFYQKLTFAIGRFIIRIGSKLHIIKDLDKAQESYYKFTTEYRQAAEDIKGHKLFIGELFLIIFFMRLAFFSVAFFVYRSFGQYEFSYLYFVSVQAIIALAVDSLPLPGGMGANEAAIIKMYQNTFGPEKATGAMILIRFANYYFGLIISAIVVMINHIRHSIINKKEV